MDLTHAGGVVFRIRDGRVEYLVVRSSDGRAWVLPKGHIEAGEREEETALREVREEAGVRGEVIGPVGDLHYYRRRRSEEVRVRFFLMRATGTEAPAEAREQRWEPLPEILERLDRADARELVEKADQLRQNTAS